MVAVNWHRPSQSRAQALEAHARERGAGPTQPDDTMHRSTSSLAGLGRRCQGACLTSADMLTVPAATGSLFHTASGAAFADLTIDGSERPLPFAADAFGPG